MESAYPNTQSVRYVYSAFIITIFYKEGFYKEGFLNVRGKCNLAATGIFLKLFTSSLLSQDLVNIEGIVPLNKIKLINRCDNMCRRCRMINN